MMDKQSFCSSQTTSNIARYAAAIYRKGDLEFSRNICLSLLAFRCFPVFVPQIYGSVPSLPPVCRPCPSMCLAYSSIGRLLTPKGLLSTVLRTRFLLGEKMVTLALFAWLNVCLHCRSGGGILFWKEKKKPAMARRRKWRDDRSRGCLTQFPQIWLSAFTHGQVLPAFFLFSLWNKSILFPSGELHLTPLHGILQLRPSFSYLDKADAKHREREAAHEGKYLTRLGSDLLQKMQETCAQNMAGSYQQTYRWSSFSTDVSCFLLSLVFDSWWFFPGWSWRRHQANHCMSTLCFGFWNVALL